MAQRCAHVHHWQTKSFSLHLALGELYETITELMDDIAEISMGALGDTVNPEQSDPNGFSQQDPVEFIRQFYGFLSDSRVSLPEVPALVNKYDDLLSAVAKIKYKIENLH